MIMIIIVKVKPGRILHKTMKLISISSFPQLLPSPLANKTTTCGVTWLPSYITSLDYTVVPRPSLMWPRRQSPVSIFSLRYAYFFNIIELLQKPHHKKARSQILALNI
jgi:hypothetical protein